MPNRIAPADGAEPQKKPTHDPILRAGSSVAITFSPCWPDCEILGTAIDVGYLRSSGPDLLDLRISASGPIADPSRGDAYRIAVGGPLVMRSFRRRVQRGNADTLATKVDSERLIEWEFRGAGVS